GVEQLEPRDVPASLIFAAQGNGYDFPDQFFNSPAADFSVIRQSFNTVVVEAGHQDVVDVARAAGLKVVLQFDYKWDFANSIDIGPRVAAVVAQVQAHPGTVAGIIVADQLN